ncbi:MAG TPA: aminoacetone oxidase family FAD-binding enzyme [Elusimicrobiales bacterium]|nr:aminoacetone oxidase family FAD-binding enzyme [Elusimicrobiales bacterium]HPO95461.1 aminoacetone oxidase family FAD-binding enzyme [Elusimicrobiales bacterium]
MRTEIYDVAIIGAGAGGLLSACVLAEKGFKTILIEKNSKIGRKILSTGAGKCNISNSNISSRFYITDDYPKLDRIFSSCGPEKIVSYINDKLGIMTVEKEKGKIFPVSQKAESVVNAFDIFLKTKKAEILKLCEVLDIEKKSDIFEIGFKTLPHQYEKKDFVSEKYRIKSKKIIIACGGPSYPQIGGTDFGMKIARKFGHRIIPPVGVITPFKVLKPDLSALNGIRMNAKTKLFDGKIIEDEILFTDYGISGPFALELSFYLGEKIDEITIELISEVSEKKMKDFFLNRPKNLKVFEVLKSMFDPKFADFLSEYCEINPDFQFNSSVASSIIDKIKNFKLSGLSAMGFDYAMTKKGGVPLAEVSDSFESKKNKGMYIIGEVLNVCGKTGGYNLHFAFTSGYVACESIDL